MSSSCFFHGLQSCLEPRLNESRVLRLKLTPIDPNSSKISRVWRNGLIHSVSVPPETPHKEMVTPSSSAKPDGKAVDNVDENGGENSEGSQKTGWSFLDAVSDDAANVAKEQESDKVYVHPAVKRSCSVLSSQSLEMCTEGLGCETGSNASDISDDMALLSLESGSKQSSYENKLYEPKKLDRRSSFPPPLTSITDMSGLQVRPHREDGRLVLKAVNVSSQPSYFHAERVNGRLLLLLMKNSGQESDDAPDEAEAEAEEVSDDEGYVSHQEETRWSTEDKEVEGNTDHVEDEMGIGKFSRPSRCNEEGSGNQVFLNRERFWVAS